MNLKSILQMIGQTVDPAGAGLPGIPNAEQLVQAILQSKAPQGMPGADFLNQNIGGGRGMKPLDQATMIAMMNKGGGGMGMGMPGAEASEGPGAEPDADTDDVKPRKVKTTSIPAPKKKAAKKGKSEKERLAARMDRENKYDYQKSPNRRPERPEGY